MLATSCRKKIVAIVFKETENIQSTNPVAENIVLRTSDDVVPICIRHTVCEI